MIALGLLVVIAIVLDVFRRIRASRYDSIRMPRRKQPVFDSDVKDADTFGSELPSGGARIVAYRNEEDLEQVEQSIKETAAESKPKLASMSKDEPKQTSLGLEEPQQTPPGDEPVANSASPGEKSPPLPKKEPTKKAPAKRTRRDKAAVNKPAARKPAKKNELESSVIVLHVMAYKDESFAGDKLKEMLLAVGLRYGSMKIFHRHDAEDGSGEVLFSVANSVNPGTFDLNGMENFSSPGISLFFSMPDVEDPGYVFDLMLKSAQQIAAELGGNVSDDTRSILTRQMIEHYRQRIAEFSRAQLSRQ